MPKMGAGLTTEKVYRYGRVYAFVLMTACSIASLINALLFLSWPVILVAWTRTGEIELSREELLGFVFVWILTALMAVMMACSANLFSTMRASDEYLATRFYFREFKIPWDQIQEIKQLGWLTKHGSLIKVSASSVPWIYAVNGALYGQLGGRYIPIWPHIKNYQDLIEEIRLKCPHLTET
jgi:hypothetical protein